MNLNESKHKYVELEGYQIHYFVNSEDNLDTIICVHSAFSDHKLFSKQITALSKYYRIICIDMMGHGLSQPNKTKDKIDKTALHIKLILEKENIEKAHLLGVSLGSLMIQYFAINYPGKCQSITVVGGYNINVIDSKITKAQGKEGLKWIIRVLFSMKIFRRYAAIHSVKNIESQERFYSMAKSFKRKSFMYMSGVGKIIKDRPRTLYEMPLLIVVGVGDIELAQLISKEFHENIAHSQFVIIPNSGHCANLDNPESFNTNYLGFLEGLPK